MTDKTIIEWEKEFDMLVSKMFVKNNEVRKLKSFIAEQLTLAEKRGEEKARKNMENWAREHNKKLDRLLDFLKQSQEREK